MRFKLKTAIAIFTLDEIFLPHVHINFRMTKRAAAAITRDAVLARLHNLWRLS